MLKEKQVRSMYDAAVATLQRCSTEVTIDAVETDAAATEKILAMVLELPSQDFRPKPA